jgi:hypothetical protein
MPDPRTNRPQHRTIAVQFEADSSLTTIRISSYIPAMFEDSALRLLIYDEIVRTGETPVVVTLARLVGAPLVYSIQRCCQAYPI